MTEHTLFPGAEARGQAAAKRVMWMCEDRQQRVFQVPRLAVIFTAGLESELPWDDEPVVIPFFRIPGFKDLEGSDYPQIKGHKREFRYGFIGKKPFIAILGRIHLYEGEDEIKTRRMVRLMSDMLTHLGVGRIVTTSLVGSCDEEITIGDILLATEFLNNGERMTSVGAEGHPSLEDTVDEYLVAVLMAVEPSVQKVAHAFWKSSTIEDPKQKKAFAAQGAKAVGCSGQPTMESIARQRRVEKDVCGLMILFVTNGAVHTTEDVKDAVEIHGSKWRDFLHRLIKALI
ncbi:hypothetical protein HQ524_03135 [Candidatus Uhrbacteria bacterium]|nr:hypothetical protein [Candidatus Uhrbacteria bacterium]